MTEDETWANEMRARGLQQVPQTFRADSDWVEGVDFAAIERLF